MMNKCTILIINNEENKIIKINPISLGIREPQLTAIDDIVEQTLDMTYMRGQGYEFIHDAAGYLAKAYMKVRRGVEFGKAI